MRFSTYVTLFQASTALAASVPLSLVDIVARQPERTIRKIGALTKREPAMTLDVPLIRRDILYPENGDRANRAEQLSANIQSFQSWVFDDVDDLTDILTDELIVPRVENILVANGFTSFAEYEQNALDAYTDEERWVYGNTTEFVKKWDQDMTSIMQWSSIIGLSVPVLGDSTYRLTNKLVGTGSSTVLTGSASKGFRKFVNPATQVEGAAHLKRVNSALSTTTNIPNPPSGALKFAKGLRSFSRWIGLAGIGLDFFTLILDAINGAQQRTMLQETIRSLQIRRIQTKMIELRQGRAVIHAARIESWLFGLDDCYSLVELFGGPPPGYETRDDFCYNSPGSSGQTRGENLREILDTLEEALETIDFDHVWSVLQEVDATATSDVYDNDDKCKEWVRCAIDNLPEDDDEEIDMSFPMCNNSC